MKTLKNMAITGRTVLAVALGLVFSSGVRAEPYLARVTLAWDAPSYNEDGTPLSDLEGYVVHYGPQESGMTQAVDVGNVTTGRVHGLAWDRDYDFAVRAYTAAGLYSTLSETVTVRTPVPLSIAGQPAPQTSPLMNSATFHVETAGDVLASSYQWRRNGEAILGATSATYVRRSVTRDDDGAMFDVVIVSASGVVTSQVAALTVTLPDGMSSPKAYQWFEVDETASFNGGSVSGGRSPDTDGIVLRIEATGAWYSVWARLAEHETARGSYDLTINGGSETIWQLQGGVEYRERLWERVTDAAGGGVWMAYLAAGEHILTMNERTSASAIDLVLVTSDPDWTPWTALSSLDGCGDGIADDWKLAKFGCLDAAVARADADPDGDGMTNLDEFVAGTSALDDESYMALNGLTKDGRLVLAFQTVEAAGPGYDGLRRYYALESTSDLRTGIWTPVPGYEAILARNRTIVHEVSGNAGARYYRTRVWIE